MIKMTKVSLCKTQMALKVLLSLKVISERSVNLDTFFRVSNVFFNGNIPPS